MPVNNVYDDLLVYCLLLTYPLARHYAKSPSVHLLPKRALTFGPARVMCIKCNHHISFLRY